MLIQHMFPAEFNQSIIGAILKRRLSWINDYPGCAADRRVGGLEMKYVGAETPVARTSPSII